MKAHSVLSGLFSVPLLNFHHQTNSLRNQDGSFVFLMTCTINKQTRLVALPLVQLQNVAVACSVPKKLIFLNYAFTNCLLTFISLNLLSITNEKSTWVTRFPVIQSSGIVEQSLPMVQNIAWQWIMKHWTPNWHLFLYSCNLTFFSYASMCGNSGLIITQF